MDNFRCPLESLMLANHEPDWNIDDLSDSEVCAAIRYLEPDTRSADEENDDVSVLICVSLYLLLIACLAALLYWKYCS
jgi:hypothetical protein